MSDLKIILGDFVPLRFRTPTETLNRRFYATDTLHTLLLYLASIGYRPAEYKVRYHLKKKDYSHSSWSPSLSLCLSHNSTPSCSTSQHLFLSRFLFFFLSFSFHSEISFSSLRCNENMHQIVHNLP